MQPVQALLFDLGNVILDIDFERAFAIWAGHAGVPVAQVAARYAHDAAYERHERGEILAAEYFASLRESLGIAISDAQFEEGWNAILVGEKREITALLTDVHARIPTYMFSNSNLTHQTHWNREHPQVVAPFRHVFVSSDIGMRKPEARAFLHVAREMGVPPESILFFDDVLVNIEGARAVGMQAVHVSSPEDVRAALMQVA